jgi:cadmium resistance protein CadD (predicted permease)
MRYTSMSDRVLSTISITAALAGYFVAAYLIVGLLGLLP